MFRLGGMGLIGVLLIGLWIYCIFDVIATEEVLIRNLPKFGWLMIVLILFDIGSLAWLILGRPRFAGWRPGDTGARPQRRVVGPEDRADFAAASPPPSSPAAGPSDEKRLQAWEADLRRREEELRRNRPEDDV